MPKNDSLALDLDCLTARGRALELNSQLSDGFGGCRWPLMPALGTGVCNYSKILLCTWEDARGIRVRLRVGMYAGCAWDVSGFHAGCTRDPREITREIVLGISRNLPLCALNLTELERSEYGRERPILVGGRGERTYDLTHLTGTV